MEKILPFISDHWMLSTALVLTLILIVVESIKSGRGGARLLPQDVTRLMNTEGATVLDVREKSAYDNGHITGAIHFAQSNIAGNLGKISKLKDKPIILVDTTGLASVAVRQTLQKEGFARLFVLAGGLNAWKDAGFPLIKK